MSRHERDAEHHRRDERDQIARERFDRQWSRWEARERDRYARRAAWAARWHSKYEYPRPEWWPENEPWPPRSEVSGTRMRRLFFIRFAIGIAIVFSLVVAGPVLVIAQILGTAGISGGYAAVGSAVIFILIMLALAGTARSARRFALPFGSLIEAAGRLENGDYSARVPEYVRGPRELKAVVASFNAMAARLEEDERQRRTLLADVSHELRTPLAVLRGELEAMIDGIHPADEAHLSVAVDEIAMLTGLVEDLRTLTLAEAGTLALHLEPTDLSVLAQEVAASFESLAAKSNVRLSVSAPEDLPLAELDPLRIKQVLGNLVANALRYSPAGSEVAIGAQAGRRDSTSTTSSGRDSGPDFVTLSVADQGPGIAPEILPHLFDRFVKSAESRGSGLGLAIARRLVEAHHGTIWVEQPPAGGTAIRFELPVSQEAGPESR